jgi:hypothetical protein
VSAIIYARYRTPGTLDEEEQTCLQFQGCRELISKIRVELYRAGYRGYITRECLLTLAEQQAVLAILKRVTKGLDVRVIDVRAPIAVGLTEVPPEPDGGL